MKIKLGELSNIINKGIRECHLSKNNDICISMDLDEYKKLNLKKLNVAYLDNKTLILSTVPLSVVPNGTSITELTTVIALKNYIDEILLKNLLNNDDTVILENGSWHCEHGELDEDEYFDYGDSEAIYISAKEALDKIIMRHSSLYLFHIKQPQPIHIGIVEK